MRIKTMEVRPEPIRVTDSEQSFVVTTDLGRFFVQITHDGTANTSGPFVQPASPGTETFSLMVQTAYHTAWRKVGGLDAVCRNKGQQQQAFFAALAAELGVPHRQGDTYVPEPVSPFTILRYVHWVVNEVTEGRRVDTQDLPLEFNRAAPAFHRMTIAERWRSLLTHELIGASVKVVAPISSKHYRQEGSIVGVKGPHIYVKFAPGGDVAQFEIQELEPA